jgi:hypothetical protein
VREAEVPEVGTDPGVDRDVAGADGDGEVVVESEGVAPEGSGIPQLTATIVAKHASGSMARNRLVSTLNLSLLDACPCTQSQTGNASTEDTRVTAASRTDAARSTPAHPAKSFGGLPCRASAPSAHALWAT